MADITDPGIVSFCNGFLRPVADAYAQLYYELLAVTDEFTARGGSGFIPNTADVIVDGAQTDGRPIITGASVISLINRLLDVKIDLEAGDNVKLNQVLAVAVNLLP